MAYSGNEGVGHCLHIRISPNQRDATLQTCTALKQEKLRYQYTCELQVT